MKVIEERKENWGKEIMENCPKDLLGLMIQASQKKKELNSSSSSSSNSIITVNDIAEECKSFFFAGEQTTSNLLTWTTVLLAMHPEWQVLARDEVLKVCGPRDLPSKDDLPKLKTVTATFPILFSSFIIIFYLFFFPCHILSLFQQKYRFVFFFLSFPPFLRLIIANTPTPYNNNNNIFFLKKIFINFSNFKIYS